MSAARRPRRLLGVASLVAFSALVAACGRGKGDASVVAAPRERAVVVAPVDALDGPRDLPVRAAARGVASAAVAPRVGGRLAEVRVGLGQRVEAGTVVARLEAPELEARLDAARAARRELEGELARERQLLAGDATTERATRVLEERLAAALATEGELETWLGELEIRAPFAGGVAARPVDVGSLVGPGQPVVVLDSARVEVVARVPASVASGLVPGERLRARDRDGEVVALVVREVAGAVGEARNREVRLDPASGARAPLPGEELVLLVPGQTGRRLMVPSAAVRRDGALETALVARGDGLAELRLVRTGAPDGGRVEILAGLAAGERVVVASEGPVADGDRLVIREALP